MKEIKIQLKYALKRKELVFSAAVAMMIVVLQFIAIGGLRPDEYSWYLENGMAPVLANTDTVHNHWIGGELSGFYSTLYWMIFPILAALPFAGVYDNDKRYGRLRNFTTRTEPKRYYLSLWTANFIVGALTVTLPLLLSILLHLTSATWTLPIAETSTFGVGFKATKKMFHLFYETPGQYYFIYFLHFLVFGGLLANVGMVSVLFVEKPYMAYLSSFILWMALDLIGLLYPDVFISPRDYISPVYGKITGIRSALFILFFFVLSAVPLFLQYRHRGDF